jgi:putative Holliday junction resolvase
MKFLGIDYGKKRIGLALSDEDGNFAFPNKVIENKDSVIDEIKNIVKEEGVSRIILGESKDFKMKDNPIMKDIILFKEELEKDFEVVLHPEVLSSHQAEKMIGEKTKMIDASAAAIILQNYLDTIKN